MQKKTLIGLIALASVSVILASGLLVKNSEDPEVSKPKLQEGDQASLDQKPLMTPKPAAPKQESPAATDAEARSEVQAIPPSKLADFPGFGHDMEKDEATYTEEEMERETAIADCMQENGFEYTPTPSLLVDAQALNDEAEFERLLAEAAKDPNDLYVQSLNPSMRESYFLTLTGLADPNIEEGLDHTQADLINSCRSKAFRDTPGVYAKKNLLSDEYQAMQQNIENDERVVKATSDWSNCMSQGGLNFSRPNEVMRHIDQSLASQLGSNLTEASETLTNQVNQLEHATSRCIVESNLHQVHRLVRIDHENKFVETHIDVISK